ncbi:MAG: oligosaccharide flippase family protein [Candidatus Marinimicrobia bacterium]|nr:oligosaccharide flippase family protein [Candidatus Neomarinimicrobiota bacterium]
MNAYSNLAAKLKKIIASYHILLENFTSLSLLQFVRIITPLILLPKLISSLGLEMYGTVVFAQTLVFFFMVIINFGFDMSGTSQIAIHKANKEKISSIVVSITAAKILLLLVSSISYLIVIYYFKELWAYRHLYLLSFLFCLQDILIPVWLFQGLEKMKFITIGDVTSRLIYLMLTLSFVANEADYLLVPTFRFIGVLFAGSISLYIIIVKEKMVFAATSFKEIKYYIKDSAPFFISKLSGIIDERTNTLILGMSLGMESVAYYDFVSKIIGAINSIFGTFIRVVYPRIASTRNKVAVRKILAFIVVLSVSSYLLLILASRQLILIFAGPEMLPAQLYIYFLGLMIPLTLIGWTTGDLGLAAFGYSKVYSRSAVLSTIIYLGIVALIYFFSSFTIMALIMALLTRSAITDIYRLYYCRKYSIL